MYNLLVHGLDGHWDETPADLETSRFTEFTVKPIKDQFTSLTPATIKRLMSLPCIFAYEDRHKQYARLGRITEIRIKTNKLQFSYSFEPKVKPIPYKAINDLKWSLDIDEWEMTRTHWAVKDVDLLQILLEQKLIKKSDLQLLKQSSTGETKKSKTAQILPSVFKIPNKPIDQNLISVMMSFDKSFNIVFKSIQMACSNVNPNLECKRADNIWEETEIIQDIFSLIYRSKIVICDFTAKNPNVFYETGIAHTLGKHVIPITQNDEDVPFDLKHHRFIKYEYSKEGLVDLKNKIAARIETLIKL